jgi:hypothetical protein
MFTQPNLGMSILPNDRSRTDDDSRILQEAVKLFNGAAQQGKLSSLWSALTRRPGRLLDLEAVKASLSVQGSHYLGVRSVPVARILGSEGKAEDFDAGFHPLSPRSRYRWQSIAAAMLGGLPLPPVELVRVGEEYFVRDGHHRISVAKALGQQDIDAEVTVLDAAPAAAPCPFPALSLCA